MAQRTSSNVERNDPCPCGSGLKYKKCCLQTGGRHVVKRKKKRTIVVLSVAAAVVLAFLIFGRIGGSIAGLGGFVILVAYLLISEPPPSQEGKGDPGAINFGG